MLKRAFIVYVRPLLEYIIVLCGRRIISRILKQLSVFNVDSRNVCLVLKSLPMKNA